MKTKGFTQLKIQNHGVSPFLHLLQHLEGCYRQPERTGGVTLLKQNPLWEGAAQLEKSLHGMHEALGWITSTV